MKMNKEPPPSFEDLEPEGDSFADRNRPGRDDQFADEDLDVYEMDHLGEYRYGEYGDVESLANDEEILDDWEALFGDELDEPEAYYEAQPVRRSPNTLATTAARTVSKFAGLANPGVLGAGNGQQYKLRTLTKRQAQICSAQVLETHELLAMISNTAVKTTNTTQAMNLIATAVPLVVGLTPVAGRALWPVMPTLVAGTVGLTRLLHQQPNTRPAIRQLPQILLQTVQKLARYAQKSQVLDKHLVARIFAAETKVIFSHRPGHRSDPRRLRRGW